jgi:hypothetical protein
MRKFIATYLFDDGEGSPEWVLEFFAKDLDEAEKKLQAIKDTLKLDGELMQKIGIGDDETE